MPFTKIAKHLIQEVLIEAGGAQAFTADQSMGGFSLTNLAAPVGDNDAARKIDCQAFDPSVFVFHEVPTGTIDGTNLIFTIANTPVVGSVQLFLRGVQQQPGTGKAYTVSGTTITFETGCAPQTGDTLWVHYIKA